MSSFPNARRTTCRMFETPLIEAFSRVHPVAPFAFWLPVLGYLIWVQADTFGLNPSAAALVLLGLLVWSGTEYFLHRYVFHWVRPTFVGRRIYFVLHGVHHDFPNDGSRLVMPLGVSIPLGVVVMGFATLVLPSAHVIPLFIGFGLGYLAYDGIHYATHHFPMRWPVGKYLKQYHMVHHHSPEPTRWGVSSPLWDYVFGTHRVSRPVRSQVAGH